MKRQFTIITKDGSKWLNLTQSKPIWGNEKEWMEEVLSEDLPYLGCRPEGTTLDESDVREVRQYNVTGTWISHPFMEESHKHMGCETRTAYTDAESHDRHISDDYPGVDYQPLFNHMSKVHGLTLTTSEMDEIIGLSTYILAKK